MTTKNSKMPINIQLTEKYEEYVCKRSVLINSPSLYSFPYKALTKLRISKIEKILFFYIIMNAFIVLLLKKIRFHRFFKYKYTNKYFKNTIFFSKKIYFRFYLFLCM